MKRLFTWLLLPLFLAIPTMAEPLPEKATLHFSGPYGLPATMEFSRNNTNYTLHTTVKIPFKPMVFRSEGSIRNNHLIPHKFTDTRGGKLYAYANFDTQRKEIQYGRAGEQKIAKMKYLSQDFFTLAWQIALHEGGLKESVQATNGKKIYIRNRFEEAALTTQTINNRETPIRLFINGVGDDRIELGIAPEFHHLPALIVYYDKGKRYELKLTKVEL